MTGVSWGVSCAGLLTWGLCWLLLRHYRHVHEVAHWWMIRAAIAGAYVAGCAIAETALGSYAESFLGWLLRPGGGPHGNLGHLAVEITGAALFASVVVALLRPAAAAAYLAAAAPFILALSGGWEYALLNVVPAQEFVEAVSRKVGG